jgi:CRISPR-associated protein Cmr5
MRSLEQQRAAAALACVQALSGSDEFKSRYRAYVDRLGPAIIMNGLGQALATESAAAGPGTDGPGDDQRAHRSLYDNLSQWMCRGEGGVYPGAGDVLTELTAGDQASYLRAQAEALAWLHWHKKFCHAELPKAAGRAGDDG